MVEIEIRRNQPFQVTPDLDQVVRTPGEGCLDEVSLVEPDLRIRGRLRFLELQPDSYSATPIVSPVGEILPIIIEASLDDLTRKQMNKTGLILTYGSHTFKGMLGGYDDLAMEQTGRADVYYWTWSDENGKEAKLMFRREDLPEIKYTLKYPKT